MSSKFFDDFVFEYRISYQDLDTFFNWQEIYEEEDQDSVLEVAMSDYQDEFWEDALKMAMEDLGYSVI